MHKLSRPKDKYYHKPRCRITFIQRGRIVQGKGANQPGGEWVRGEQARGANWQKSEKARHL